jgi:hypothetical protein
MVLVFDSQFRSIRYINNDMIKTTEHMETDDIVNLNQGYKNKESKDTIVSLWKNS